MTQSGHATCRKPPNKGGDNMTIARTIAITAVVCAAIGMTTQTEAAKRKAAGGSRITLIGCAYTELVCGTLIISLATSMH